MRIRSKHLNDEFGSASLGIIGQCTECSVLCTHTNPATALVVGRIDFCSDILPDKRHLPYARAPARVNVCETNGRVQWCLCKSLF